MKGPSPFTHAIPAAPGIMIASLYHDENTKVIDPEPMFEHVIGWMLEMEGRYVTQPITLSGRKFDDDGCINHTASCYVWPDGKVTDEHGEVLGTLEEWVKKYTP